LASLAAGSRIRSSAVRRTCAGANVAPLSNNGSMAIRSPPALGSRKRSSSYSLPGQLFFSDVTGVILPPINPDRLL
jgi:hypothetical protein